MVIENIQQFLNNRFDGIYTFSEDEAEAVGEYLAYVWENSFEDSDTVDIEDGLYTEESLRDGISSSVLDWDADTKEELLNLIYDIREDGVAKGMTYGNSDFDVDELNPFRYL